MGTDVKIPAGTMTRSVTASYQMFAGFAGQVMPNPDSLIKSKGVRFDTFREMLLDGTISGKFDQLFAWVLTKKLTIKPASEKSKAAAETVKIALANVNIDRLLAEMLTATQFGYAVQEIIWKDPKQNGGAWLVDKVVGRVQERFGFGYDGKLKYNENGILKDISDQYKFIVMRHGFTNENYYGTPLLSKCYWHWMFKKAGFRFWITAAEKFGVPTVIALFQSDDEKEQSETAEYLAGELSKIQNDAAVALANVDSIQTLEASGNAQGMFKDFVDMCNAEISKAITGETMTSENGSGSGSFALSNTHADTLDVKTQGIANEIAQTLRDSIVSYITWLNHGFDAEVPAVVIKDVTDASWEQTRDAIDRSIPVSLQAVYDNYGIPQPKDDEDTFVKPESSGGMYGFSDTPEGEQSRFFQTTQQGSMKRLRRLTKQG